MELILSFFSYSFLTKALLVGSFVAISGALLGVSLVLKRYSMIGDGLSHVGFGALSLAFALNLSPLMVSIPLVIFAAFFLLRLSESHKIHGDSAIAIVSSGSLALGILVTSLAQGSNVDINSYMFGSILAMSDFDVVFSILLSLVVIVLFLLFYHQIFAITFDETFSTVTGTKSKQLHMLMAILTAVTIVIGMRIMGTLLISSLIIFPALTSMQLFRSFQGVILSSSGVSVVGFTLGIFLSFSFSLPTGPCVVVTHLGLFFLFFCIAKLKQLAFHS